MPGKGKRKKKKPVHSRSYTMSRIKGSGTKIEVAFRRALWRAGIRYRKNYKNLPGKPDLAITKNKIAIFCDCEFWHGKDWQQAREKLRTRREFWVAKIERNIDRDNETDRRLAALGWTVLRFWGRDIEKNLDLCVMDVKDAILQSRLDRTSAGYIYDQHFGNSWDELAAAEEYESPY